MEQKELQLSNQNPKFVILDTCTFIEFLNNDERHYNLIDMKKMISKGTMFVISPYTVYEYLINIEEVNLEDITNKLAFNDDFWVLNVNHIFNDYEGYLDGRSFVFRYDMHTRNYSEFRKGISKLKSDVYSSLSPKIYLIAEIITSFWLIFTESRNDCSINSDTLFKIQYLDSRFLKEQKKHYDSVLETKYTLEDIKYHIHEIIMSMVLEMLSISNVELYISKNKMMNISNEKFTKMIIEEISKEEIILNQKSLKEVYKDFYKRTNKQYDIDYYEEWALSNMNNPLMKKCFKIMINKAFSTEGFHKKQTNNDIIDFTNLCLVYGYEQNNAAFLTSEKKWIKFILKNEENSLKLSQMFLNKYINKDYLGEIIK